MSVKQDAPAMQFVALSNKTATAKIYVRGATLASFQTNGVEWLGTRGDAKFDGSKPNVSGGIPICFPQFGHGDALGRDIPNPDNNAYSIPVHGLARNMDWNVASSSTDAECILELRDTEESRAVWPHAFCLTLTVTLDETKLSWSLEVENKSQDPLEFSCGVHSYFKTLDIDAVSIRNPSLRGCTKLNRTIDPAEPMVYDSDEVRITNFTDDIYKNILPSTMVLHHHEGTAAMPRNERCSRPPLDIVSGGGWKDVVVWNPHGNDTLGYKSFLCVESVATKVALAPLQTWSATLELIPQL